MRYIPLKDHSPDQLWIDKANKLLDQLKNAPDAEARNQIIDKNSSLWSELKEWLLLLSHQKCWFSEAKDCFSHWDVEHFRPKKFAKDADGTEHDGYWWLAFDWQNFRICGNVGNRKKGTYFPLRTGCTRASNPGADLRYEDPQLLDPIDEDDCNLLSFNSLGEAIPAAHLKDEWERERVKCSVKLYRLDSSALEGKRKVVWTDCYNQIKIYLDELGRYHNDKTNVIAKEGYKRAAKAIREMMQADRELSSVTRACVLSTGDERLRSFIRSA